MRCCRLPTRANERTSFAIDNTTLVVQCTIKLNFQAYILPV